MQYVRFGDSGLMVSRLCLGAMNFPLTCDPETTKAIFHKAFDNGVNFIRTWMANWWLGIEAPRTYAPGYEGLGKYNMENAWKLDYLLSQGRRRGIYIELTLLNHGLFHRKVDSEWYENPYNVLNGGPLKRPSQFFTDPKAKNTLANFECKPSAADFEADDVKAPPDDVVPIPGKA